MIKHFLIIICFALLPQCCKRNEQEKLFKADKIEYSKSRFCLISNLKMENQKAFLFFDQVEYKNNTSGIVNKIIEMPNGFCFSNDEEKIETIEIDSNSVLIMQTFSFNNDGNFKFKQSVSLTDFINVFTEAKSSRFKMIPFRILSTGTKIDSLFEIYIQ